MDAYFDVFSGICGNMVLGALLDLGLGQKELERELTKLGLCEEYRLSIQKVTRAGISGTHVQVQLNQQQHSHGRNLAAINNIIDESSLSDSIKWKSKEIYLNLAKAEARIHGKGLDEIHFHEVGALDAVVEIVGIVIGIELLGIKRVRASKIHTGTGFVWCEHGQIPVPAPVTMELLKGVPLYSQGIEGELVTPTGAAVITTLADGFGPRPEMVVKKSGYGVGSRQLSIPGLLRINLGQFL
jgi:hypothetical protein